MTSLGKSLLVCLLPIAAYAGVHTRVPNYAHVNNPQCSCNCENKIVYSTAKVTYKNLVTWAKEAATSSYTYGFGNYEFALQKASQYFTENGWKEFAEALEKSGNLDIIYRKKLLLSAIPNGEPKSIKRTKIHGRDGWIIELPILIKYESDSATTRQSFMVTMSIVHGPAHRGVQGLGIEQFVVQPV